MSKTVFLSFILFFNPILISNDIYVRNHSHQPQISNFLKGLAACFNGDSIFIFISDDTYRWVKCVPQPIGQFKRHK